MNNHLRNGVLILLKNFAEEFTLVLIKAKKVPIPLRTKTPLVRYIKLKIFLVKIVFSNRY